MGWGSGSSLFDKLIESVMSNIPDEKQRMAVYDDMIDHFEDCDCDTLGECLGKDSAFDREYYKRYPEEIDEPEEEEDGDDRDWDPQY